MRPAPLLVFMLPIVALGLPACSLWGSDPRVAVCEESLREALRWPSSYDRRDAEVIEEAVGLVAVIEFEANNGYGEPVRNRARCRLEQPDGEIASGKDTKAGRSYTVTGLTIESALAAAPMLRLSRPGARTQEAAR